MLVLSIGHITPETNEWLANVAKTGEGPAVSAWEYGWFFYADEEPDPDWPADLRTVMDFARRNGCEYLLLDCDAATAHGLAHYAWSTS